MKDFNLENIPNPKDLPAKELTLLVTPNEYGGIYDKPKKPKPSFLKSRLNKDNFWNMMFFIGLNLGFLISYLIILLTDNSTFFSIAMWVVILGMPYIIKRNSGVTFNKEKLQFLNRNNEVLNARAPNFFLMLVATFTGCGVTIFLMESLIGFISQSIAITIFVMMITFIPTLYCILKNFPIAVYFRKETYIGDGTARSYSSGNSSSYVYNPHSESTLDIYRNSPVYSWYSGNIYHRNR